MTPTTRQPYTFDRVVRIIITIISIIGAIYVINLLKGALLPFAVAMLAAYLLDPIVTLFQRRLHVRNRLLAIICTLLLIIGAIGTLVLMVAPSIMREVDKISDIITTLSQNHNISNKSWYQSLMEKFDWQQIGQSLEKEDWQSIIENAATNAWALLTGSLNQIMKVVSWTIVLLYLVFILLDFDKIVKGFKSLIPSQYRSVALTIISDVEDGMNRYFRGQSLIALLVGIGFSIGFMVIGLPLAIPLGLFIGLLNLVPYLQIIGFIPTILLCFLGSYGTGNFWTLFALSMAVFAVVQTIQDTILVPRIMGKVTGLNPAVILLSLSIWGSLMGVLGMIIALPLTTILLSYYQKYILKQRPTLPSDSDDDKSE